MKTILVDDEIWMLAQFKIECHAMQDIELVGEFRVPEKALAYAQSNRVDLAFLDIEMPGMSGLELMDKLRTFNPDIVIIIVSAHDGYVGDAIIHRKADGFVLKPYTKADVEDAVLRARLLAKRQKKPIYIHTFGRFNVYVNGEPIIFRSHKAKEVLACIVSQYTGTISNDEIFQYIWGEDRPTSHDAKVVLFNALARLKKTLELADATELLLSINGEYKINTELCDCDYYQLLDGEHSARKKFNGNLLSEYSWAENINADLIWKFKDSVIDTHNTL